MGKNVLEIVGSLLELNSDDEFIKNSNTFLDAKSYDEEVLESKQILFNLIASRLYSPEWFLKIREEENSEWLFKTLEDMSKMDNISDDEFYKLLDLVKFYVMPLKKDSLFDKYENVDCLIDLAEKAGSTAALETLNLYKRNSEKEKLCLALEEILEAINQKAMMGNSDEQLSNNMKGLIKDLSKLVHEIEEALEYEQNKQVSDLIDNYVRIASKTNDLIERELNSNKGLVVKVAKGLADKLKSVKKPLGLKLMRSKKVGCLSKVLVCGAVVVLVSVVGTWQIVPDKKEEDLDNHKSKNSSIGLIEKPEQATPSPIVSPTPTPTASPSPDALEKKAELGVTPTLVPTPTTTPVPTEIPVATLEPSLTSMPTEEPTPDIDENTMVQIEKAANTICGNWSAICDSDYDYDTIVEIIKCLNGYESSIDIETADALVMEMINNVTSLGAYNMAAGERVYEINAINVSDLLLDRVGKNAVIDMQNKLNGMLTDEENMISYAEGVLRNEVMVISITQTVGGLGINSGDAGARLLWSRLAIGINGMTGSLDVATEVMGKIYNSYELSDVSNYEAIAQNACGELSNGLSK